MKEDFIIHKKLYKKAFIIFAIILVLSRIYIC
jgi:hypothetical protein